ncbi:alginate lyase family protein [Lunatimonas salinarum]|uniref:alginate lyase family protein n=1 Tax=Lunatimonas salinarum TaxID=1774590 RepID=UPI001ADF890F|nr:alginate lyase family protein [Lunatimonas salinarum]
MIRFSVLSLGFFGILVTHSPFLKPSFLLEPNLVVQGAVSSIEDMNSMNAASFLLPIKFSSMPLPSDSLFQEKWDQLAKCLNPQLLDSLEAAMGKENIPSGLLQYFRTRNSVNHPAIHRIIEQDLPDDVRKVADDALEHRMVGQPSYPAFFVGEDIDWGFRPVKDNEWVWQLNRMSFWDAMGRAYSSTEEEVYAAEWSSQLVDWVTKNPRDEAHAYAWRSIEAGIRGYRWTHLFYYFLKSCHFDERTLVFFLSSLKDHTDLLMESYRSGSNWALMEAEGLAFIALTFPEFNQSQAWLKESTRRLGREITHQVYPDGHQRELAFGYHMGSIGWFLRTYQLAQMNGKDGLFPPHYMQMIEKMAEVPMKLAFPDGTTPQFGDAWTGKPGQYYRQLMEWAKLFERQDFLYVGTEGKQGRIPVETAFAYPHSGLYSMRSSWESDAICMVLKCGPDGGGHSQPDNGTFELVAGGRNLTPDSGSFIYSGDAEGRAWFRQSKVHQTLTLNGENTAYKPSLLLWQPGEKHDILVVENQHYKDLSHRRAVIFYNHEIFILVDEALGMGTGMVDLNFQLAPGPVKWDREAHAVATDFADGYNLLIKSFSPLGLSMEETEGYVSYVYTKKETRPAFSFRKEKELEGGNSRFITALLPFVGEIPSIQVDLIGETEIGSSRIALAVTYRGVREIVQYELP